MAKLKKTPLHYRAYFRSDCLLLLRLFDEKNEEFKTFPPTISDLSSDDEPWKNMMSNASSKDNRTTSKVEDKTVSKNVRWHDQVAVDKLNEHCDDDDGDDDSDESEENDDGDEDDGDDEADIRRPTTVIHFVHSQVGQLAWLLFTAHYCRLTTCK